MSSFSIGRLAGRTARYYARQHLALFLGMTAGSAILIGALLVGDSVRGTLRDIALNRLGSIEHGLFSGDRLFRGALAGQIGRRLQRPTAGALQLPALASRPDGNARANQVQVIGVTPEFWRLARLASSTQQPSEGKVAVSEALARQLGVKKGDSILLRVQKPSSFSREAPISPQEDSAQALPMEVEAVVGDKTLGRFSLQANQLPPFNAFVSRSWLQQQMETGERINLLLVAAAADAGPDKKSTLTPQDLLAAVRTDWLLDDAELQLRKAAGNNGRELVSRRIFLEEPVESAIRRVATNAQGILTYFVNDLRLGERSTPYSMVAALESSLLPLPLASNEMVINQWLAEDLQATTNSSVAISYFVLQSGRRLEQRTNLFQVKAIVPMTRIAADRSLMPDFPGLANAENTRDWDAGFPIDLSRIREKDETYWKEHRGTPKAFISLGAGQTIWSNRFGALTALRMAGTNLNDGLEKEILGVLDPSSVGLNFQPVREQALVASAQGQDFGELFLGLSFFLIAAALILIGLLYGFAVEQRAPEIGILLAVGLSLRQVKKLFLLEGAWIALAGAAAGSLFGLAYAALVIHGLNHWWQEAVAATQLRFVATPKSFLIGGLASLLFSLLTLYLVLRKLGKKSVHELLVGAREGVAPVTLKGGLPLSFWLGATSLLAAFALLGVAFLVLKEAPPPLFFGSGTLLLLAGIFLVSAWFRKLRPASRELPRLAALGFRNVVRRRRRSLAIIGLLASGTFLVIAVQGNRLEVDRDPSDRKSGTGGFAFIAQSALPVVEDLNSTRGREMSALDSPDLKNVSFVSMRVRDGDEASCLNLNRAQQPRVLGVPSGLLEERRAFEFVSVVDKKFLPNPWSALRSSSDKDVVPAIADHASVRWALGKKPGDELLYLDEAGRTFRIRIVATVANSILQGNLLIDEAAFQQRFPGEGGYRMFLVDAPSNRRTEVASALSRGLRDSGLELTPAGDRLAAFNAVQNTYLNTFLVLGMLGVILGSVGLGIVVLRNVLERRGELGVMSSLGFQVGQLRTMLFAEHAGLLLLGVWIGSLAAFLAILPLLKAAGGRTSWWVMGAAIAGLLVNGLFWTWLSTRIGLRGNLIAALRNE